jgi:hypothetical protein
VAEARETELQTRLTSVGAGRDAAGLAEAVAEAEAAARERVMEQSAKQERELRASNPQQTQVLSLLTPSTSQLCLIPVLSICPPTLVWLASSDKLVAQIYNAKMAAEAQWSTHYAHKAGELRSALADAEEEAADVEARAVAAEEDALHLEQVGRHMGSLPARVP